MDVSCEGPKVIYILISALYLREVSNGRGSQVDASLNIMPCFPWLCSCIIPALRHEAYDGAASNPCATIIGEIGKHAEVSPHGP